MINDKQVARRLWEDEGFRPFAYEDTEGFLTVGVGILIDKRRPGAGLTAEEGVYLLRNRIFRLDNLLANKFPWYGNLEPARQQVVLCMAYQLGINGVANFKKMVAAIEAGDFVKAADEMLDSKWARQTPSRAKRMANMMERGEWIEPSTPVNQE
jgi:lysozyme